MKGEMKEPFKNMFRTAKEACIFLLEQEDTPLDPAPEVRRRIEGKVGCSRWTVFRAIDDLIMKQVLLLGADAKLKISESLPYKAKKMLLKKREPTKQVLQRVVDELKSHLRFLFEVLGKVQRDETLDTYVRNRLELILSIAGVEGK